MAGGKHLGVYGIGFLASVRLKSAASANAPRMSFQFALRLKGWALAIELKTHSETARAIMYAMYRSRKARHCRTAPPMTNTRMAAIMYLAPRPSLYCQCNAVKKRPERATMEMSRMIAPFSPLGGS